MKRLLVIGATVGALLGAAALVTPALAEDAPAGTLVPGAQLAQVPPPPPMPAMIDWNGLYGGVLAGARFGTADWRTTCLEQPCINAAFPVQFANQNPSHFNLSSAELGGLVGWNFQFGQWVAGPEADFQWAQSSTTHPGIPGAENPPNVVAGAPGTDSSNVRQDWDASVRARLGYLFSPKFLGFVTAGVTFTEARDSVYCGSPAFPVGWCATPANVAGRRSGNTQSLTGFTVGAGGEYAIDSNWHLRLQYRYSDYGSFNSTLLPANAATGPLGTQDTIRTKISLTSHEVQAALIYKLGAPPPPPPAPMAMPAPAAAAPRVFIVFFDWDKDTITREGMGIIDQAADAYKSGAPVQIQVTGYTDRSGSPGYNQRLSERRANNVAKALAARGVPPAQMVVSGRGENDNRVPTADGVREPQNRRVEIIAP